MFKRKKNKISKEVLNKIVEARKTGAKTLDLSNFHLESLPESVTELKNLTSLFLRYNRLRNLPKSFSKLKNLVTLDLRSNRFLDLPNCITKLSSLTSLDLNENPLINLPPTISQLTNLNSLYLRSTRLTSFPEILSTLSSLITLDLSMNSIQKLPEEIGKLSNLTHFNISYNHIERLPINIKKLVNLTNLNLSNNQLNSFPEIIIELNKLEILDISMNQLDKIPPKITNLKDLTTLYIKGNPLENPPLEIASQGIQAIRNYFEEIGKNSVKLYEAKMLIVGQGVVGKTSLKNKLVDPNFNVHSIKEDDRTHGIEVDQWALECKIENQNQKVILNIWDFGGQEIYHSTHQFFLTKRSVYLLLGDTTRQDNQLTYWLNIVGLLGEDSPVLLIMNKIDLRPAHINQEEFKGKFPQIRNFHNISALTGLGIEDLKKYLEQAVKELPHLGDIIPGRWESIRTRLKKNKRNYITYNNYIGISQKYGLSEKQAGFLIDYLHDLGNVLHFRGNELLRDFVILKPEWGTQAIYQVLDTKLVPAFMREQQGHFNLGDLRKVWIDKKLYPPDSHKILLELMRSFELCFQFQDTNTYVVPELLPEDPPLNLDFNSFGQNQEELRFEYRYDFMPKGLLTRFICRTHQLIKERLYWKSGVIVQYEGSVAFIKSQALSRKISIQISGVNNKELLSIIRSHFVQIYSSLHNLHVIEMIPCICSECRDLNIPHFYEYDKLQRRVRKGKETVECEFSYEDLIIKDLFAGIQHRIEFSKIENLVRADNIDLAIKELKKIVVDSNSIFLLENRWRRYNKSKINKDVDRKELELDYTQICKSILDIIRLYRDEYR